MTPSYALRYLTAVTCALYVATTALPVRAQTALSFSTHAAFFSTETHQPTAIDPQVFVQAAGAPAGVGAQNITHAAGLRNARLDDPASTEAYNAQGQDLHVTVGRWFGATGTVRVTNATTTRAHVEATFAGLIPNGIYSLFENHFTAQGVTFTPLDGSGTTNSFTAKPDGTATASLDAPGPVTHDNAILLVYHSDGQQHGMDRGVPGVTALHQLIARIP